MAKGYPERRIRDEDAAADIVVLEDVIGEGTCIICKKRPGETRGLCAPCHEALHPGEP